MQYKISQVAPYLDDRDLENLKSVIKNKWITEGPFSEKLLKMIKDYTHAKYALLVNNGTLGLYLSLKAIGLDNNDEVIVPDFTFMASASSVIFAGGKPVLIDVFENDYHINFQLIEKHITEQTKAIMPVHIYGQSADMDPIIAIAEKYNIKVIEDAAQGYGVFYKGKHTGTIGDIGVISFFADKTVTMGEGGIVLTNDEELYQNLRLLRNQGRTDSGSFIHPALGMNFRVTDLQCALGVSQLEKFKEIEHYKMNNLNYYKTYLSDVSAVKFMEEKKYCNFVPFRFPLTVNNLKELTKFLEKNGVQTRNFFYPLHKQPCLNYLHCNDGQFPVSIKLNEVGLVLPIHPFLKEKDIEYICGLILSFYN